MLRRFGRYLEKIFHLDQEVQGLRDGRGHPQIPVAAVWKGVFLMFALRLASLNRLEQELRRPGAWRKLLGGRPPSADTVGYCLSRLKIEPLRHLVAQMHRRAWRNKAVKGRPGERHRVVAIDGHELWSSEARCCDQCLTRTLQKKEGMVTQYYHRVVVAQWIGVTPPGILDVELMRPGEGEVVAARRLLARILRQHRRLIDVISADALYLEAPFLKEVVAAGKHFVVVLKQQNRDLYQDAESLRTLKEPQVLSKGEKVSRIWDLEGLTTFTTFGHPVRVVWADERQTVRRVVGGEKVEMCVDSRWVWVTDLSPQEASASAVQRMGHDRWDVENRGFNELVQHWNMNHCFVHDPTAIEVLLLTLAVAFLTTYLFYQNNLKEPARRFVSRLTLASRLLEGLPSVLADVPGP